MEDSLPRGSMAALAGVSFAALAVALIVASPANAQETLTQSAPAMPAQDGAGEAGLPGDTAGARPAAPGEIVVTANKREQNLNNVGLSVSAFSGDMLARQGVDDVADLAKITPGLTFAPSPTSTPVYTLRGVGFFEQSLAAYPDVSLYIDQAPLPLPVMSTLTAFDLERVEVLKGPQGTLFGNNATGGAINFVAAKPTRDFSAGGQVSYGRFNTIQIDGFVSGPLTDNLRARFAFRAAHGDEWQKSYTRVEGGVSAANLALGVPAGGDDKRQDKLGKTDNIAARAIVDWTPTDRITLQLNVNGWRNQDDPQAPQYIGARLQYPIGTPGAGGGVQPDIPIANYPIAPRNNRAADWDSDLRPYQDNKFWQATLRADYNVTDDLTLTSLTGYDYLDFLNATDSDGTALKTIDVSPTVGKIRSFTQEIRLANGSANRLRFTLGANYENTKVNELDTYFSDDATVFFVNGFFGNQWGSRQRMKNYAAFGNLEFDLTDQITLKGGIRQTKVKRHSVSIGVYETPGFFGAGAFGPNSLTTFFNATYAFLYGGVVPPIAPGQSVTIDTRTNPDGTPVDPATYLKTGNPVGRLNEDSTSWSVGVDFKPASGTLFYLNISKGYKAGSFPTLAGAIYSAYAPVKQESIIDYEAGFKLQMLDRKLSVNGSAFYYDYRNKQLRAKFVDPIFGQLDNLQNVPKSVIKGAELVIRAYPVTGLTLSASALYLDTKVKNYQGIVGSAFGANGLQSAILASFKGADLPFSPKWSYSVRGDYSFPLSENLSGFMGLGVNGQSKSSGALTIVPADIQAYRINARTLVDGTIGVEGPDGEWRLAVWGKNIFNKYYWTQANLAYDSNARYTGRPSEYGVSAAFKF